MQFGYHGKTYDSNASKVDNALPCKPTPYILRYRGVTYQAMPKSETSTQPVQTITRQLIYRGNTYSVTRTIENF